MSEELSRLETGLRIERRAEEWFLAAIGGTVLARNYRLRSGEIDLVLEVGAELDLTATSELVKATSELVFVEVRARLPGNWQSGLESIGGAKQRRLSRAIRHFLMTYRGGAASVRVDVLDWDGREFTHYRDVRI